MNQPETNDNELKSNKFQEAHQCFPESKNLFMDLIDFFWGGESQFILKLFEVSFKLQIEVP